MKGVLETSQSVVELEIEVSFAFFCAYVHVWLSQRSLIRQTAKYQTTDAIGLSSLCESLVETSILLEQCV